MPLQPKYIKLTEEQTTALDRIAGETGSPVSACIRAGIDLLIDASGEYDLTRYVSRFDLTGRRGKPSKPSKSDRRFKTSKPDRRFKTSKTSKTSEEGA